MGFFGSKKTDKEVVLTYPKLPDSKTPLKIEYEKSPLEIMTAAAKEEPRARFWSAKRTGGEGWTVFAGKSNAPAPVFVPSPTVKVPKRLRGSGSGTTSSTAGSSGWGGGDGGGWSGGGGGDGGGYGGGDGGGVSHRNNAEFRNRSQPDYSHTSVASASRVERRHRRLTDPGLQPQSGGLLPKRGGRSYDVYGDNLYRNDSRYATHTQPVFGPVYSSSTQLPHSAPHDENYHWTHYQDFGAGAGVGAGTGSGTGAGASRLFLQPPHTWQAQPTGYHSYNRQPTGYAQEPSDATPRRANRRRPLPCEKGGPIPDGVMDDPHAADAHDLFFSKLNTPEFESVVERKRKENNADGYDPFAMFCDWNACAVYERENKELLPQAKARRLEDGTKGILKHPVASQAPEYLRCLPLSERPTSADSVSDLPENRKRRRSSVNFNYKDPAETKEEDLVTRAWDKVKWNMVKRPIMAMRARRR